MTARGKRPATRERVLRVIDELGYRRNDSARMLKSGRSTMLGVVLAGSELFELPRMLLGIEQAEECYDRPPGQAPASSWRPTISAIHTGAYGGVQPGEAG